MCIFCALLLDRGLCVPSHAHSANMGSIAARNAHAATEDCVTTSQDSASVWLDTVATGKRDTKLVKIISDLISVIIPLCY